MNSKEIKTPQVFKDIYDLNLTILQVTKSFPREYKYSLGEELRKSAIHILEKINPLFSNPSIEKVPVIAENISQMQYLRLLVRLAMDVKCMNTQKFTLLNQQIEKINKQLFAWQKAQVRKTNSTQLPKS